MPSSNLAVAPLILHLVWQVRPLDRPIRVLDVGPGHGKYGVLVREYVDPGAEVWAVEAWEPYVDDFRLRGIYDRVVVADVLSALTGDQDVVEAFAAADVVLLIDVIEHLPKNRALQLLDMIPGWVIVCTPRDFFPNPADLPHTEAHISHWTADDFPADRLDYVDAGALDSLGAVVVRLRPR